MEWYFGLLIILGYVIMMGITAGLLERHCRVDELSSMMFSIIWPVAIIVPIMKIIADFIKRVQIMDYEKKYKEAMERAKQGRPMDEVFPELVESEDERIRKEIMEYLTITREKDLVAHPERQRWIAYLKKQKLISDSLKAAGIDVRQDGGIERHTIPYLEKQKEQNDVPSRETILGIWELGNFWKENPEERDGLTQLQYIQKYWNEKCDYQKEQKPAEQISNIIAKAFENSKTDYSLEEREKASDYSERVLPTSITYGEDENEYRLHKVIEAAYIAGQQEQKLVDDEWLKKYNDKVNEEIGSSSYNVKDCAKSTEWSEEDEKIYKTIYSHFTSYNQYACSNGVTQEDIICFLESLRPSWKPSEEQLLQLRHAISGCSYDIEPLVSLEKQLKQL